MVCATRNFSRLKIRNVVQSLEHVLKNQRLSTEPRHIARMPDTLRRFPTWGLQLSGDKEHLVIGEEQRLHEEHVVHSESCGFETRVVFHREIVHELMRAQLLITAHLHGIDKFPLARMIRLTGGLCLELELICDGLYLTAPYTGRRW